MKILKRAWIILLLFAFVGCSQKVDSKKILTNVAKNMAEIENVYYIIDGKVTMPSNGINIEMDFEMDLWAKNIKNILEGECKIVMTLSALGMKEEMSIYYKDGKTYLEQGNSKMVTDSFFDLSEEMIGDINSSYTAGAENMLEKLFILFDVKGKKVQSGTEIIMKINKAILKEMNEDLAKSMEMQGGVREISIVILVNDDEIIESVNFNVVLELEQEGKPTMLVIELNSMMEILEDNYEIEYPDFSEFIEQVIPDVEEIETD
jgi:hypothetical protein